MDPLAVEAVDAIDVVSGVHPGYRAAHEKGTLLTGTFSANADGARLTIAAHMRDEILGRDETAFRLLAFDPARVTPGIELTDDPILRFRPKAYSVSVERRTGSG